MILTNSGGSTLFVPAIGRTLQPGESTEISDSEASLFANHPVLSVSGAQATPTPAPIPTPTPTPTPTSGANVTPTPQVEDTAESETDPEKEQ